MLDLREILPINFGIQNPVFASGGLSREVRVTQQISANDTDVAWEHFVNTF